MKYHLTWAALLCCLPAIGPLHAQAENTTPPTAAPATLPSWGDLGNGNFANPILNGDYSDPDVIRVGEKYYMICSDFHFMGMPVLESDDMVNWRIIAQIFRRMDLDGYSSMHKYGHGSWAPALRYHDGKFWMFVCTPSEGLFMSTATDPAGPWSPLHCVAEAQGWEDPCPLWDDDGQAYKTSCTIDGVEMAQLDRQHGGLQLVDAAVAPPVAEHILGL